MTKTETYTCDKCHAMFDTEQECREHEAKCKVVYVVLGSINPTYPRAAFLCKENAEKYIDARPEKDIVGLYKLPVKILD